MKFSLRDTKKLLIGCLSVFIVAILVLCIFGFNAGHEIRGYIEVKVSIGEYNTLEDDYTKKATKEVLDVLKENGATILQTNLEGSKFDIDLVVVVKNISKDRSENIAFANELKTALDNHYNDAIMVVSDNVVTGVVTDASVIKLTYTLLITMIIIMIYSIFRIRLLNTICVLMSTVLSVMNILSLIILTRVQVNLYTIGLILITAIMSMIINIFCFADIRNSNSELTQEKAERVTFRDAISILFAILAISDIVFVIAGTALVRSYAITVIYSLIAILLSNKLVCGQMSYYLSSTTVSKKKIAKEASAEITEELPTQETNN